MLGKTEVFCLDGRSCACWVSSDGAQNAAFLCGWNMTSQLPALAQVLPETLLFFAEADGGCDFTPWPAPPVWGEEVYAGGGPAYLRFLKDTAFPYLQAHFAAVDDPARRGIFGYSLGGLFALWALCETDFFGQAASISGSLWYPGFTAYLEQHRPQQAVYLSLGDREPYGGPPLVRTVGHCTEEATTLLRETAAWVTFEWNRGGHAKGVESRWEKALHWAARNWKDAGFCRQKGDETV